MTDVPDENVTDPVDPDEDLPDDDGDE